MINFIIILFFFQEESYKTKGTNLMFQASKYVGVNDPYYKEYQKIKNLRFHAVEAAQKIRFDQKEINDKAKSKDIVDRVTASYAIALGTISTIDDNLFNLLTDESNIVSISAREAFVYIANNKLNNFIVDQGPPPSANANKKQESSALWRVFFFHHSLTHGEYSKKELKALDELIAELQKEWAKGIKRKIPKQLDSDAEEDKQDPLPTDLIDPSTYTVMSIFHDRKQFFRKR